MLNVAVIIGSTRPGRHGEAVARWAFDIARKRDDIGSFDAFVFVTPEYNHSTSGALKNAIDFLYKEWNDKVAGFVSSGS
jgi:NAD(P)H-dependent FMN reductase